MKNMLIRNSKLIIVLLFFIVLVVIFLQFTSTPSQLLGSVVLSTGSGYDYDLELPDNLLLKDYDEYREFLSRYKIDYGDSRLAIGEQSFFENDYLIYFYRDDWCRSVRYPVSFKIQNGYIDLVENIEERAGACTPILKIFMIPISNDILNEVLPVNIRTYS